MAGRGYGAFQVNEGIRSPVPPKTLVAMALMSVLTVIGGCEAKERPDTLPAGVNLLPDIEHF